MPWTLDIHMIDVGQGECTFIVARDPTAVAPAPATRSILIDGGHRIYAKTVNDYIANLPGGAVPVDHILTSHYDVDHSGGVQALLIADNLDAVCRAVGSTAPMANIPAPRPQLLAGFTAAACAAMLGAYGPSVAAAGPPILVARGAAAGLNDANAMQQGITSAEALPPPAPQPLFAQGATKRRDVARRVGLAATNAVAGGFNVAASARAAAYQELRTTVPAGSRFRTLGRYRDTHVIDIGPTAHMPAAYGPAITGQYTASGNYAVQAPNTNRMRTTPALGDEVLFDSGPGAAPPPANAPAAVVTAISGTAWPTGAAFPPSGQPDNDDSIGLVIQFNEFVYWTAGDLPSQGEDVVGNALMANPLPDPAGGFYPQATSVACFKCGHHGSATATSPAFLAAVNPVGAMISAGNNPAHQHPRQATITALDNAGTMQFFYLTNCNFARVGVPRSNGLNQLTAMGNRSRVAGDNALPNLPVPGAPARHRGNVVLRVVEAQSLLPAGNPARWCVVGYWDLDAAPAGPRVDALVF